MAKKTDTDLDLEKQIKQMEDASRAEAMTKVVVVPSTDPAPVEKMSFDQWWMVINRKIKMRTHLKEILHADFKARGLSKLETEQKYDDALRLFGYTW